MITECYYSSDGVTAYKNDYILRIPRPQNFKKHVVIVHNTIQMAGHEFYFKIIEENLIDYKSIYTSEPKKVNYSKIKRLDQIEFNSKYDIKNINEIIDIVCTRMDTLYTVFIINDGLTQICNSTKSNVNLVNINPLNHTNIIIDLSNPIKIIKTNILHMLNKIFYFDTNSSDLLIYMKEKCNKQFINWFEYNYVNFPNITFYIELSYSQNPDLLAQFICLTDEISNATFETFSQIKRRFLHSLNYFNTFVSYKERLELIDTVSTSNTFFNIFQNNIIGRQLETSNPIDNLFLKAFSITPNYLTSKQSKTYISNRIKINKSIKLLEQISKLSYLESNEFFQLSLEQYTSPISLSNWYDEYKSNGCLGILVRVNSTHSDRMGWTSESLNVQVTSTLIGREQIYDGQNFFWEKHLRLDNGKMETSLISGSAIGSGNSLIPLYINQYHWDITTQYIEELVSIGITQNPYLFKPKMYGLYAHTLLNLISETVTNPTYIKIRLLIQLIISIDKLGIKWINRNDSIDIKTDITIKFIKWIKCKERFDKITQFKIYEEITKNNMKKDYKTKNEIQQMDVVDILNKSINKQNIVEYENLCVFVDMIDPKPISEIIEMIDSTYGYICDSQIDYIKESLKSNTKFFNINDMFSSISSIEINLLIKCFTYQNFLTRTQKLKSRLDETNGSIDFTDKSLTPDIILNKINQYEKILF